MKSKIPDPDIPGYNVTAAGKIFDDYGDFIKKVICSQIQDEDQAEDLFQNLFLSLVNNPLPGDIQNIESYLYKVITNDISDAIRLKKKYENYKYEYAKRHSSPRIQEAPEKLVLEVEEANRLFELLEKLLPRSEAQAVRYQYRDGLSVREIAEKMSVQSGTVRGYISEGLSRIRRLLRDIGVRAAD